jgi:fucose permease
MNKKLIISRIAISALFFTNGFLYANWTARLPELQTYFGLNNAQLGTVLFCIALGSMVAMPASGWLSARYGTDKVVRFMSIAFCACIPLVPVFQNEWYIRICFFLLGAASGCMDVTMNGQAVQIEKQWGKTIISSFHAVFSIGMALGAGSGSLFAKFGIGLNPHLQTIAFLGLVLVLFSSLYLVKDQAENNEPNALENEKVVTVKTNLATALWAILPFGMIAFCCMTGEGAMVDWSAIFMNKVIGQDEVMSAWAFGTFGVAMTVGRTFGDYFTVKLGSARIMLIDSILAISGLGIALAFEAVWSTFLGFFLVGLGLSTIVPIVFSLAGNTKGVSTTVGISMVTSIGYTGFFVGPPIIGFLAEAWGLRLGLGFVLGLFLLMFLMLILQLRKNKR